MAWFKHHYKSCQTHRENSPTYFLNSLLRLKIWFIDDLKEAHLNERYLEIIRNKIKIFNQKKVQDIHAFNTDLKQLVKKLLPHPSLKWSLRKTHENLRIQYKVYISRNAFLIFTELGRECHWSSCDHRFDEDYHKQEPCSRRIICLTIFYFVHVNNVSFSLTSLSLMLKFLLGWN